MYQYNIYLLSDQLLAKSIVCIIFYFRIDLCIQVFKFIDNNRYISDYHRSYQWRVLLNITVSFSNNAAAFKASFYEYIVSVLSLFSSFLITMSKNRYELDSILQVIFCISFISSQIKCKKRIHLVRLIISFYKSSRKSIQGTLVKRK